MAKMQGPQRDRALVSPQGVVVSGVARLARWLGMGALAVSLPLAAGMVLLLMAQEAAPDGAIGLTGFAILVFVLVMPVSVVCLVCGLLGVVLSLVARAKSGDQPWVAALVCGLIGAVLLPLVASAVSGNPGLIWDFFGW